MVLQSVLFQNRPSRKRQPARGYRPQLEALEDRCLLSGGVLDPTFGSGGLVTNTFGQIPHAVATYPNEGTANDGKIVEAVSASGSGRDAYMAVVRYNLNGTLDSSFGGTGEVTSGVKGLAWGVAVQADGKVVVAGWSTQAAFEVVRFNPDGSLDTSFGSKGLAVIGFSGTSYAFNVAVQADGKIVVAGQTQPKNTGNWDITLARLNTNGSLDSSFGAGGKVVTQLPYSLNSTQYLSPLTNLAIDPNTSASDSNSGKLLVVVRTQQPQAVVVRYNTNGTLDTTFGSGTGYVNLGNQNYPAVVVQSDDRIVVAGTGYGSTAVFLARLNADGTLDASFGSGGIVVTSNPQVAFADSVALQANGQIVVCGTGMLNNNGNRLMVGRYNTNGSLDITFGTGGFAMTPVFTANGRSMALEPDGRIIVAGLGSGPWFTLARFLAAGPQIRSFTASPNPVTADSSLNLTASNIGDEIPSATITQVAFYYIDSSSTQQLLGYGTQTSTGVWNYTFTVNLASSSYTILAQAEDSYGVFGDPVAITLTVN